jgi:hypothetical protein
MIHRPQTIPSSKHNAVSPPRGIVGLPPTYEKHSRRSCTAFSKRPVMPKEQLEKIQQDSDLVRETRSPDTGGRGTVADLPPSHLNRRQRKAFWKPGALWTDLYDESGTARFPCCAFNLGVRPDQQRRRECIEISQHTSFTKAHFKLAGHPEQTMSVPASPTVFRTRRRVVYARPAQ